MRRTTHWAVFTSMNQQQPVWRSMYEPAERDGTHVTTQHPAAEPGTDPRSAPDARRDRVEFM